jgi:uncharacterized protein YndB with AHSA1/START domain
MTDHELGTLTPAGDRWRLTFTRRLAHPRDKVWRAITEPEHLAAWFPDRIVGELRAGARLRFVAEMHDDFEGEMVAFDPPAVMELLWGTDSIRIELEPESSPVALASLAAPDASASGSGGPQSVPPVPASTLLRLVVTFDEEGKAARDGAGWHECLDRLVTDVAGGEQRPWGDDWRAKFARYQDHLGPAASTIGPPENWEEHADQQR